MTVLLALSTADRLGAFALLALALGLGWVAWYLRPRPAPPRPTRTAHLTITPDLRMIQHVPLGRPLSHLRTLGPRPFDWSIDDPDLGTRRLSIEQIAEAYDVPVDLIAPEAPADRRRGLRRPRRDRDRRDLPPRARLVEPRPNRRRLERLPLRLDDREAPVNAAKAGPGDRLSQPGPRPARDPRDPTT